MRVSNSLSIHGTVSVSVSIGRMPDNTISDLSIFKLGMTRPGPSTNVMPVRKLHFNQIKRQIYPLALEPTMGHPNLLQYLPPPSTTCV